MTNREDVALEVAALGLAHHRGIASELLLERLDLLLHRDQLAVTRGELLLQVVAGRGGLWRLLEQLGGVDEADTELGCHAAGNGAGGAEQERGDELTWFQVGPSLGQKLPPIRNWKFWVSSPASSLSGKA
jgi:hypothetical protein